MQLRCRVTRLRPLIGWPRGLHRALDALLYMYDEQLRICWWVPLSTVCRGPCVGTLHKGVVVPSLQSTAIHSEFEFQT